MDQARYWFRDVLGYLARWTRADDYAKLVYMAFLAQYRIYRFGPIKVAVKYKYLGSPITRTTFYIGEYVILPEDDEYDPVKWNGVNVPERVRRILFNTVVKYDKYKTWKLLRKIRLMLGLTPLEKYHYYWGWEVDEYLRDDGYKIIKKEV